jgi:hypothetical protein
MPVLARGQWTGGPTGPIYYSGGNVGIGTTAPTAPLHLGVNTKLRIDGAATAGDTANYFSMGGSGTFGIDAYGVVNGRFVVLNSGKVGIGTGSPTSSLDIVANSTASSPQLRLRPLGVLSSATSVPSYIDLYSSFDNYPIDQIPRRTATIKARYSGGIWGTEILAFEVGGSNDDSIEPLERMRITASGNVGIGTTSPQYKLSVEGAIGARDIIVTNTPWSDYVFQPGYRLRSLGEVDTFIRQYRRLPDIPSEAEVKEKGVSVAEMQAKLLAKIEELTLHLIQANKRIEQLERQSMQRSR